MIAAPFRADPEALVRIGRTLRAVGYTGEGFTWLLGDEAAQALAREQLAPALRIARSVMAAGPGEPDAAAEAHRVDARQTAALVAMLALGDSVSSSFIHRLLLRELIAAGLVEPDGVGVRAVVELRPLSVGDVELLIASDLGHAVRAARGERGALPSDHVVGVGGASLTLAQLVDTADARRVLDLGTGGGIQALALLTRVDHVTATDVSERALAFAWANAALNADALSLDVTRLDERLSLRQGSLFEPVRGERFDLVVSNPPFVITPPELRGEHVYRDGGRSGDALMAELLAGLPDVLEPGGRAQLLGNWEVSGEQPWQERVAALIPPALDAWVIERERLTPLEYALHWGEDASGPRSSFKAQLRSLDAALLDFSSRGVREIGMGQLWLRRRAEDTAGASSPPMRRFEAMPQAVQQPLWPAIALGVAGWDWCARRGIELDAGEERLLESARRALAGARFVVAADVTEERHFAPGSDDASAMLLRQGAGFRRVRPLTTELSGFVSVCDGSLTTNAIVWALAELMEVDAEALERSLAPAIVELVCDGFLLPYPRHETI